MSVHSRLRSRARNLVLFLLLSPRLLANHGPGTSGGGSSTLSGETLRAGKWEISLRSELTRFEDVSRSEAEQKAIANGEFDALERAFVETLGLAYGLTDDVELGAQIGYYRGNGFIDAEEDGMGGAESATADPEGLTDLWLTAKWRFARGAGGHASLIGGIKLPTGEDDEELSNGERLEPSSQPGTGAIDAQLGLAYSRFLTSRWTIDASGVYTARSEHDDFQVGDRFDLGTALAYRVTEDVRAFPNLSVSAELLGVWIDEDEEGGAANENSGGTTVYLAPGLRERFNEHVALSIAPAFPVLQDLNGEQVETEAKLLVSLSFSI